MIYKSGWTLAKELTITAWYTLKFRIVINHNIDFHMYMKQQISSPLILLSLCHNIKQINTQHLSSLIFEQFECE
jgi:hypothetical protein